MNGGDIGIDPGFVTAFMFTAIGLSAAVLFFLGGAYLVGIIMFAIELLNAALWGESMYAANSYADFNKANAGQAIGELLGMLPVKWPSSEFLVKWLGVIFVFMVSNNI